MVIENKDLITNSLQVSVIGDIAQGDFIPGFFFLIKNITQENIELSVVPAGQSDPITTVIYPGWNPELIKQILNAPSGLQYGY